MKGLALASRNQISPSGASADVEPGVVAEPERAERGAADLLDPLPRRPRERAGEHVADALPRPVVLVPLGGLGGDPLLRPGAPLVEDHLGDRQNVEVVAVADQADVELAAVHELLGDGRLLEALVHHRHPLGQRRRVLHHRGLGDAGGGVALERLDDEREAQVGGPPAVSPGR